MNISLYDRRIMILILKRNGRRSFTEGSHVRKIKDLRKSRERYEPLISFENTQKSEPGETPASPNSTAASSDDSFGSRN
jgi:hypothetical protein